MTDRKEDLRKFLDSVIDDNQEQAQVHFHGYLEDRMRGIIHPEFEDADVEFDDDDEEDDVVDDD